LDVCVSAQTPAQSTVPVGHAHMPPVQMRLPAQICAQKPQLSTSLLRLTHEVPHLARPPAQLAEHALLLHTWPIVQRLPHPPQLKPSDVVSVQNMPQLVCPGGQTQLPAWHVAPNGHWLPHEPQLRRLFDVSTHMPNMPHDVCPVGQPAVHMLLTHWLPGPHRLPQPPQLRGSVVVSVH
jgi:hypothetical protein